MISFARAKTPIALAAALVAMLLLTGFPSAIGNVEDARRLTAQQRTTINLTVWHCRRCRVQPVQNKRPGFLTWQGPTRTVRHGAVTFQVPTRRTNQMAFVVYAPFDNLAQGGVPMVVTLGFKGRPAGAKITRRYSAGSRVVSGCWRGTTGTKIHRTLIVRKYRTYEPISDRHVTVAAGYFTQTLAARPYWHRTRKADQHAFEALICR